MAENDQQNQGQAASEDTGKKAQSSQQQGQQSNASQGEREPYVPRDRFDSVNQKKADAEKRARDAESRLQQIEQEREQAQEQQAQEQGQYQKLAEQRLTKLEKLETELKQVKASWTEERRRNTWNQAAQGIIKPGAVHDAYLFLDEQDLSAIEEGDMEGYKKLAQNLAEVRDYLSVEGVLGAGSGGSARPVMGLKTNANGGGTQTTNRQAIFHNPAKKRRPWK